MIRQQGRAGRGSGVAVVVYATGVGGTLAEGCRVGGGENDNAKGAGPACLG